MPARPRYIALLLLLLWLCGLKVPDVAAQTPSPSPSASASPTPSSLATLQARLAAVQADLAAAPTPSLSQSVEGPDQPPPYYNSLLRMETALRRLISLQESEALVEAQIRQVESQARELAAAGLSEKPPYPITLLDDLQVQLASANEELEAQTNALLSAKADVQGQETTLKERQALRRRLLEQATPGQEATLEAADWAVKAAETALELSRAETALVEKSLRLAQQRRDLLSTKVQLVSATFQFKQSMLVEQLAALEKRRAELSTRLGEVTRQAEAALVRVKSLGNGQRDEVSAAELEAETEWLTTYQRQKILLEQALELNLARRDLWERRFEVSRGQALNSLSDWDESTRNQVRRLRASGKTLLAQLNQVRGRMAEVVEAAGQTDDQVQDWKNSQARALAAHQSALELALEDTEQTEALAQRLLSELKGARSDLTGAERARRVWGMLVEIWRIELYSIGDDSVTVGKVIVALLVLVLGLTLTGRATRFFGNRLLSHLPLTDAGRANGERGVRYFFILMVFLFALRVVNIPLTIFTFLGGTLAIAIGFGAQNILNNFISGLILMVERPVRVGDLIEVQQTTGVVEEIGARSTRVRMGTGIHVVLPNSMLLENQVVNWTLAGQTVRTSVSVGVAYGSDTAQVMELLSRAALGLQTVEKSPPHFVVLEDFADSCLKFTVHFWVSVVEPLNKRMTESALRLAIEALFREHDISIPFPQRDLNVNKTVSVQLVADDPNKESSPT